MHPAIFLGSFGVWGYGIGDISSDFSIALSQFLGQQWNSRSWKAQRKGWVTLLSLLSHPLLHRWGLLQGASAKSMRSSLSLEAEVNSAGCNVCTLENFCTAPLDGNNPMSCWTNSTLHAVRLSNLTFHWILGDIFSLWTEPSLCHFHWEQLIDLLIFSETFDNSPLILPLKSFTASCLVHFFAPGFPSNIVNAKWTGANESTG